MMAEDKKQPQSLKEMLELFYRTQVEEPTQEELERVSRQMEQVAERMKKEGPQQSGQPDT